MAVRGAHAAQAHAAGMQKACCSVLQYVAVCCSMLQCVTEAHAAGTAMGVGTDMVERWNSYWGLIYQVVHVGFLQQVQVQS